MKHVKLTLFIIFLLFLFSGSLIGWTIIFQNGSQPGSVTQSIKEKVKPLEKYAYENLANQTFEKSPITLGEVVKDEPSFTSQIFYFKVDGKKVSGLANFPKTPGIYPVIVMFRGYVDREIYQTGIGTQHGGEVLAQNGFITLAPDFLGYGGSDNPSENPIEERFQTYTTALTLLSSVENLNDSLGVVKADTKKVGIWGHSNGGQIAISVLEISGKNYPTVLWAPVSKPFPYSILYYTDEFDDHGKALRRVVSVFEKDYDAERYSPEHYLNRINAPIQLHQGTADEAVPQKWSDELNKKLTELEKQVQYFVYPGEDHNFANGSWNTVILRSISFYNQNFADEN